MSIADDVAAAAAAPPRNVGRCVVCWHLDRITGDDRKALDVAFASLSAGKIVIIMTSNGHPVSKSGVLRHLPHHRQEPTTA